MVPGGVLDRLDADKTGFFPQTLPEYGAEGGVYWGVGLLAALGLFASILLHELGHVFVARRFGIPVRGIRLFVFGGVADTDLVAAPSGKDRTTVTG